MSLKQAIETLRLLDSNAADKAEKELEDIKSDSFIEFMKKLDKHREKETSLFNKAYTDKNNLKAE